MDTRIYVGNLPFKTTDNDLKDLFAPYGNVIDAIIIRYKESQRSKGYAFVVMERENAQQAIAELNDAAYQERPLKIRLANERTNFPVDEEQFKTIRFAID